VAPARSIPAAPATPAAPAATKGFGTDERALINILTGKTAYQMEQLRKTFEAETGKTLVHVIEKETSHWFEYGLRGLVLGPLGFDVWLLHRACHGAGTHEDLLTEVLVGRTNQEIEALKAEYHRVYHKDLVHVVRGELSMKTERMFNMILAVFASLIATISNDRPIVLRRMHQLILSRFRMMFVIYMKLERDGWEPMKLPSAASSSIDPMLRSEQSPKNTITGTAILLTTQFTLSSLDTCNIHCCTLLKERYIQIFGMLDYFIMRWKVLARKMNA
jgi:Annexin